MERDTRGGAPMAPAPDGLRRRDLPARVGMLGGDGACATPWARRGSRTSSGTHARSGGTPTTITADLCVRTIPPPVKQAIAFATRCPPGRSASATARRSRDEDEAIFVGITNTNLDPSTVWYPSYGVPGRGGMVVGPTTSPRPANAISHIPRGRRQPLHRQRRRRRPRDRADFSSGIGPSALGTGAPAGTPERYVDPEGFPGGPSGRG